MTHPIWRATLVVAGALAAASASAQTVSPLLQPPALPAPEGPAQPFSALPAPPVLSVEAAEEVDRWAAQMGAQRPLSVDPTPLPPLRSGDRSEHVLTLRTALEERGHLDPPPGLTATGEVPDLTLFDPTLEEGVRTAQRAYGLTENGQADRRLYTNLAGADASLGRDLAVWGSELRWRAAQAQAAGHRKLIVVNVPSYTLRAIDLTTGATLLESRVIVGKPSRRTPLFTTNVVNLKYNPDWTPPPSLARQGKRYVAAGPNNPLGRVRFSTDNNQNIYLHHTNEPDLFDRPVRALSSGCIRVDRWDDLAAFVADASTDHVHERVATRRTLFDPVDPVPVMIVYSTVDVVAGQPGRFPDVYGKGMHATAPGTP